MQNLKDLYGKIKAGDMLAIKNALEGALARERAVDEKSWKVIIEHAKSFIQTLGDFCRENNLSVGGYTTSIDVGDPRVGIHMIPQINYTDIRRNPIPRDSRRRDIEEGREPIYPSKEEALFRYGLKVLRKKDSEKI